MENQNNKRPLYIPVIFGCYYFLLFMGAFNALRGLTLPQVSSTYNIGYTESGLMFLLPVIPAVFANIFSGYFFSKVNKKWFMVFSAMLLGLSIFALPNSPNYFWFLVFTMFVMAGINATLTTANITIPDIFISRYPKYSEAAIGTLHFFYGIGASTFLILGNILVKNNVGWQSIFLILAGASSVLFFSFLLSKYPKKSELKRKETPLNLEKMLEIIKHKKMILYLFCISLYTGSELSVTNWATTFLKDGYGMTEEYSSIVLIAFFICIAVGRFLGVLILHKVNLLKLMFTLISCSVISVILGFVFRITIFGFDIFIPLLGLFFSVMFVSIQTFMVRDFENNLSAATGIFFAAATAGPTIFPFLIGVSNDIVGVKYGCFIIGIFLFLIIPLLLIAKPKAYKTAS